MKRLGHANGREPPCHHRIKKRPQHPHSEYLRFLPLIALALLAFSYPASFGALATINLLALVATHASAFSVVRHADVQAHRLGEPYGSLILTLSVVILEVSLISALMVSGKAAPELMRDTLYSIVMIVSAGLAGFSLRLGGYKFATQYVNLGGIKQYLIAWIPLAIIVLVLPMPLPEAMASRGWWTCSPPPCMASFCCAKPAPLRACLSMSMRTKATIPAIHTTVSPHPTAITGMPPGCWPT